MKKIFRILPPLQWCSLLFAAFAAILQTLAMLFCYEKEINHFSQGSILPILALVCFGLSIVAGIIAALITPKAELAHTVFSSKRNFPLPAFGFALLTDILLFCLISTAIDLWQIAPTGEIFLQSFLSTNNKIAVPAIPFLILAVIYYFLLAIPAQRKKETLVTLLGFGAVASCMLLTIYLYFDMSVLMTAPAKTFLQAGLLSAMIFITGELRYLLGRQIPRLFSVCATLLLATGSISAISIPIAFFCQKLPRADYLACSLLLLSMIPHAMICLIRLYRKPYDISNQQEPISQQDDSERNSL